MIAAENNILKILRGNKNGEQTGITSVCSANPYVIKAALINAKKNNQTALIESTSNQVDQYGGYTGITPSMFRDFVFRTAGELQFPEQNLVLGGDHLGPNRWQDENTTAAMEKAREQIEAYITAGYTKIHLDTTMKCADDGSRDIPLNKNTIAERAALLCLFAEETFSRLDRNSGQPVYIIGTDVPPPGGASNGYDEIHVTPAEDVEETIRVTHSVFNKYGLADAWERVAAVVVQPGVEFGDALVFDYHPGKAVALKKVIEKSNFIYEAHSTDYQKKESLREMVKDHFAILKVGPWLTFALREAVFALAFIERELLSGSKSSSTSNLLKVIESGMLAEPKYWLNYYSGSEEEKEFKRKYSYSDRIRYYWAEDKISDALNKVIYNLRENIIPYTLVSQFMPEQYNALREGRLICDPEELILHKICGILEIYNYATNGGAD
jgi:D-tagatose-1,6-bisphosphate aldolase subunit GatZ/KbaZ